jgi:hypothetical protein
MCDVDVLVTLQVEDADVRRSSESDATFIHPAPQARVGAVFQGDGLSAGCVRSLSEEVTEVAVPVLQMFHEGVGGCGCTVGGVPGRSG